ncbi:hypothetical protein [Oceanobacillus kapialis]|uniref:hypothetical protein n=1 Tax=Oceanobacillus kapialis TaxID=481353 RepID=UPI00384DBBDC
MAEMFDGVLEWLGSAFTVIKEAVVGAVLWLIKALGEFLVSIGVVDDMASGVTVSTIIVLVVFLVIIGLTLGPIRPVGGGSGDGGGGGE